MNTRFCDSRLIQVIETIVKEGAGTGESPFRQIIYYTRPEDGKVLAKHDPLTASVDYVIEEQK